MEPFDKLHETIWEYACNYRMMGLDRNVEPLAQQQGDRGSEVEHQLDLASIYPLVARIPSKAI